MIVLFIRLDNPPPTQKYYKIIEYELGRRITCDVNAHRISRESTNTNERGLRSMESMAQNSLIGAINPPS